MMRREVGGSLIAIDAARAEAKQRGTRWGKLALAELETIAEHLHRLAAVTHVPVIDGEFVDATALYHALGAPKPGPTPDPAGTDPAQLRAHYERESARVDKLIDGLLAVLTDQER